MKEVNNVIRQYTERHDRIKAEEVAEWLKAEHPALFDDYTAEAANAQLLSDIKRICNETLKEDNAQSEFKHLLDEVQKACPGLPRMFSVPDAKGKATYVKQLAANDDDILADISLDKKGISAWQARVAVKESYREFRNERGVRKREGLIDHYRRKQKSLG